MNKSATNKNQPDWVANLKTLMTANGLNPRSLSLKAGLGPTAVRDMIEGRARYPRYDTVQALAKTLGVTEAELMGSAPLPDLGQTTEAANETDDLALLTDIIARLQEAAIEHRHNLKPDNFAAMVTTLYQTARSQEKAKKPFNSKLSEHIAQLISYETLRNKQRKN